MAQLTSFSYHTGCSLLHRLDARFKLLFMLLLSIASIDASFLWLFLLTPLTIALLLHAGINLLQTTKELKLFFIFLFFILVTRSLTTEGEALFSWWMFTPTGQGLEDGLRFTWRLLLVILLSLGFVSSTRTNEIKAAVEFYFARIPFVPEKRVSTMLSLLLRFIPLIFSQMQQTMDAQKARCIETRRNPIYRLEKLTIPTLHRIFRNGESLAIAMTARCYNENRTGTSLRSSTADYAVGLVVLVFALLRLYL